MKLCKCISIELVFKYLSSDVERSVTYLYSSEINPDLQANLVYSLRIVRSQIYTRLHAQFSAASTPFAITIQVALFEPNKAQGRYSQTMFQMFSRIAYPVYVTKYRASLFKIRTSVFFQQLNFNDLWLLLDQDIGKMIFDKPFILRWDIHGYEVHKTTVPNKLILMVSWSNVQFKISYKTPRIQLLDITFRSFAFIQ